MVHTISFAVFVLLLTTIHTFVPESSALPNKMLIPHIPRLSSTASLPGFKNTSIHGYAPEPACFPRRPFHPISRLSPPACLIILDQVRNFPNFHTIQEFRVKKSPSVPQLGPLAKPPYTFLEFGSKWRGGDCAINLDALQRSSPVPDKFSWEQFDDAVVDILVDCRGSSGRVLIGLERSWQVTLYSAE